MMTERTYRPLTILRSLNNLRVFLLRSDSFESLSEDVQKSILLGLRFVDGFCVLIDERLPGVKPLATYQKNPTASFFHAMSFLQGEMALESVESEYDAWERWGEPDMPEYNLYLLNTVHLKAPALYRDWLREVATPSKTLLNDISHDAFMNDWTNFQT